MEKLAIEGKGKVLDDNFFHQLAKEFNRSARRGGHRALQAAQVQGWFLNKLPKSTTKLACLPTAPEEKASEKNALASKVNVSVSEEKALASEVNTSISEEKAVASEERRSAVCFWPSEIAKMEKLAAEGKEKVLDDNFFHQLAKEFNRSARRGGHRALQAAQVQGWFLNKLPKSTTKPACLPTAPEEKASDKNALASEVNVSVSEEKALASEVNTSISEEKAVASEETLLALDTSFSNNENEVSPNPPEESKDKVPELEELEFEAKSGKDSAWYDIGHFLAYRTNKAGEVEVKVRFEGFGASEDEWVNVKKSIRQRSIPLESAQCRSISEGDLVLCFREEKEAALHFDAHIVEIQRKQHDIRGCRCVFLVEYDHDSSQEKVSLRRLSRRPKYF